MFDLIVLGLILHEFSMPEFRDCLGILRQRFPPTAMVSVNANGLLRENNRIEPLLEKLQETGVDLVTLGDQALARTGARNALQRWPKLVRPLNLPAGCPGQGATEMETSEGKAWMVSLFTGTDRFPVEDPIEVLDAFVNGQGARAPVVVDFFGPNLALKKALAWRFADRLPCVHVMGTGLGVATDDLAIQDGCAFTTDVGMVGEEGMIDGLAPQEWWNLNRQRVRGPAVSPACALRVDGVRLSMGAGFRAQAAERIRLRYPE